MNDRNAISVKIINISSKTQLETCYHKNDFTKGSIYEKARLVSVAVNSHIYFTEKKGTLVPTITSPEVPSRGVNCTKEI